MCCFTSVSVGKPVAPTDDAEIKRQRAEAAKQRHFAAQQRRLQEYRSHGSSRSINADTLIESILGKSESTRQPVHNQYKSAASGTSAAASAAVESSSSVSGG